MRSVSMIPLVFTACNFLPEPLNEEVGPPENVECAVSGALDYWQEYFEYDLDLDNVPPIRWFLGDELYYPDDDNIPKDDEQEHVRGLFTWDGWGNVEIHLLRRKNKFIYGSLSHELLHWAGWINDKSDSDHTNILWEEVSIANDYIKQLCINEE